MASSTLVGSYRSPANGSKRGMATGYHMSAAELREPGPECTVNPTCPRLCPCRSVRPRTPVGVSGAEKLGHLVLLGTLDEQMERLASTAPGGDVPLLAPTPEEQGAHA